MNAVKYLVFILLAFTSTNAELRCYDCDPFSDNDQCATPEISNVKTTVCSDITNIAQGVKKKLSDTINTDIEPRGNFEDTEYECYSLYFVSDDNRDNDNNKTGIYRGCYKKTDSVISVCELIKEELNDGNVTQCVSCGENQCNVDQVGSGAAGLITSGSLGMLYVVNLTIFLLFFSF